nr:MAG TPA: hypothetical protein [Caudoviricetes sp.]
MEFKTNKDGVVELHVNLCKGCKEMLKEYNPYVYAPGVPVPLKHIKVHTVDIPHCENTFESDKHKDAPVSLLEAWKRLDAIEQQYILHTCGIRGWAIENYYQLPNEFTYDEYCDCIEYSRGDRQTGLWSYSVYYHPSVDLTVIIGTYLSFITGGRHSEVTGQCQGKVKGDIDHYKTNIINKSQEDEEDFD